MKKMLAVGLGMFVFAQSLSAQFGFGGFGEIVHDPISYANAILMYAQLELQYDLAAWMSEAVPVNMGKRYRAPSTTWLPTQPPTDRFGKLSGWTAALNGSDDPLSGYTQATESLDEYGTLIDEFSPQGQEHLKTRYSSVEMTDGMNLHGIQTLGQLRKTSEAVAKAIQALEDDSLSFDPAFNTEVAVLNKINAASVVALRNTQDTNKLLGAVLEQQLAASKRERDAATLELNAHILRLREGGRVWAQHTSTMADSLKSMRLP